MDITAWTGLPPEIIIIGIASWTLLEITKLIVNKVKTPKG